MKSIKQKLRDKLNNKDMLVYIAIAFLVLFYLLTFSETPFEFKRNANYLIHLSDALINGRLNLINAPDDRDISKYNGKEYVMWGIWPSVVLIPFVYFFGTDIKDTLICCILGVMSIIIWFSIYRLLMKKNWINITNFQLLLFTCLTIFGTDFYNISSLGGHWYTYQTFNFLFLSLSIYFLFRKSLKSKFISSVFFSFSFLTKNSILVVAPFFYLMLLLIYLRERTMPLMELIREKRRSLLLLIIIVLPLLSSICFQFYYNYIRFDDPLESGVSYHNMDPRYRDAFEKYGPFSKEYVPHNIEIYFFNPVRYKISFFPVFPFFPKLPFLDYDREGNSFWSYQLSIFIIVIALFKFVKGQINESEINFYLKEVRYGIIALFNKGREIIIHLKETRYGNSVLVLLNFIIWVTYLVLLLFYMATGWVNFGNRYLLDVQPFLSLAIVFSFNYVKKDDRLRIMSYILIVLTILIQYQAKVLFSGGDIVIDTLNLLTILGSSIV